MGIYIVQNSVRELKRSILLVQSNADPIDNRLRQIIDNNSDKHENFREYLGKTVQQGCFYKKAIAKKILRIRHLRRWFLVMQGEWGVRPLRSSMGAGILLDCALCNQRAQGKNLPKVQIMEW